MAAAHPESPWAPTARSLYLVAMAVFLVTIGIGIPNALNVIEFDRNQVLTHVHSGTLGWLTLTLVATTFVAYRAADRRLALALAVCVPVYVAAFYTGSFALRAATGVLLLAVMLWLLAWTWQAYLAGERTLPRLGFALAITTFTYGGVVGTLLQVGFAMGITIVPGDGIGAHAGAMTFGYLALAGMAAVEWKVLGTTGLPRAGLAQYLALFVGGFILSLALLTGASQAGAGLYLLAELVAVVLFAVRVLPRAVRTDWMGASASRHLGASAGWIVVALALFMYLVSQFMANPTDPAAVNIGLLVASDHAVYIGVITNMTFGVLILLVGAAAGSAVLRQLAFWGMNVGLAVFVVGLALAIEPLKMVGAPVMGLGLLVGMAALAPGLLADLRLPEAETGAATT